MVLVKQPHPSLHLEPPERAEELDDARVPGRGRQWRPRVDPAERRQVIESLFGNGGGRAHWSRYFAMLTLSAIIATAGLSSNSGAVVIGAMLVAPLMTPIVGVVAAVSLNMPRRATIAGTVVVVSTLWTVATAFVVASALPDTPLGTEVLSRTAPDARDLLVALAAGMAGTWATARTNVSAALPGVAVAVALVPPLAAVGVTLQANELRYAEGALLLFVTNLVAIIGIGTLTMVAVGFVPTSLLTRTWHTLGSTAVISLLAIAGVSWPLWQRSQSVARDAHVSATLEEIVDDWLQAAPALEVDAIARSGRSVTIDVVGPVEPPPAEELVQAIVARLDDRFDVRVRWLQRLDGPLTADDPAQEESPIDLIGEAADAWLVEIDRGDLVIEAITMSGTDVVVRVTGPRRPPGDVVLQRLIDDRFPGAGYVASIVWSEVTVVDDQSATLDALRSELAVAAERWAAGVDVEVVEVSVTFEKVVVRTAGVTVPSESGPLHRELAAVASAFGVEPRILVSFEERHIIPEIATTSTSTTPTTTTTSTTTTTTTPTTEPAASTLP